MEVQQQNPLIGHKECSSLKNFGFNVSVVDGSFYLPENIVPSESNIGKHVKNSKSPNKPKQKQKKRPCKPEEWSRNIKQKCRNSGKEYEMYTKDKSKKSRPGRSVKSPCTEKCRLKCFSKLSEEDRLSCFSSYWSLANIEKQRQFILNSMDVNEPRYRYVKEGGKPRQNNMQYFLTVAEEPIQVCKLFFMNTLDINSRNIATVLKKSDKLTKVLLEEDRRGKHGKHAKAKPEIRDGIKLFLESIPKIESLCVANAAKLYIDVGNKSVADLHKEYVDRCRQQNVEYGKYALFYRIFHSELNMSLYVATQDHCELCSAYENAEEQQKTELKKKYEEHILGKLGKAGVEIDPLATDIKTINTTTTTSLSLKKDKKRKCKPEEWRCKIKQKCRNSGKEYEMYTKDKTKKHRPSRSVKSPCTEKCRLKCFDKFSEDERLSCFTAYWSLGNIEKQRQFILNSMVVNKPRYRYVKQGGNRSPRQNNMHYFLTIADENPIQVCRTFFMNTLDINSRNIVTVLKKSNKLTKAPLEEDRRGKHGKHRKVKQEIRDGIQSFIESLPNIDANTTKLNIDGIKTLANLHKNYIERCRELNMEYGNYVMFCRMFNSKFKKEQCDVEPYVVLNENEEQKTTRKTAFKKEHK